MAQQQHRPSRRLRAAVQAAGGGQVETARIAFDLEYDRRQCRQPRRLFRNPQAIGELGCLSQQQGFGRQAEEPGKAGRIGQAQIGRRLADRHPKQRPQRPAIDKAPDKRQGKAGQCPSVAAGRPVHLGERSGRQPATERLVEACRAGRNPRAQAAVRSGIWVCRNGAAAAAIGSGKMPSIRAMSRRRA